MYFSQRRQIDLGLIDIVMPSFSLLFLLLLDDRLSHFFIA